MTPNLHRLAGRIAALAGWRRRGVAFACGLLAVGALPPLHALPLLIPAFAGLVWLLDGAAGRKAAFGVGWWFGLAHFGAGFYWVAHSMLVKPEQFAWLIPFAIGGLGAGMALYTGLAALLARALWPAGWRRILVLAGAWTLTEALRGWLFTGFPWNLMATVWAATPGMLQPAALVGAFGLSLFTVALAAMPATLGDASPGRRGRWLPTVLAAAALAATWTAGVGRLASAGPVDQGPKVPDVLLRLVQPNIDQRLKWHPELRARHVADQIALSAARPDLLHEGTGRPTHVVWAETAVPFYMAENPDLLAVLARAVPPDGLLITGAPRRRAENGRTVQLWNSLHAVDGEGRIVATYDKHHLVPFGEYVPLKDWLPLAKLTEGAVDYSAGPDRLTLRVPGLPPFSPLICYEIVYPGKVVDAADRPAWMLALTNDGWFGLSSGPYQHFAAARLRAVEEGVPVVRVANTGISGVVDPYGRTVVYLELGRRGVVDTALPRGLDAAPPFARYGNAMPLVLAGALLLLGLRRPRHE